MTNADQGPAADKPTPKKSEKRQRGVVKGIRFLDEEFNAAAANASAAGMTFGAFVRAAATGSAGPRAQRRLAPDATLMRQVLAQLGKYGNNMNQIAYQLNAHGESGLAAEFQHALKEWGEIRDSMLTALGKDISPRP
jgi:hypothetical protein